MTARHGYRPWEHTTVPHEWMRPFYTDGYRARHAAPEPLLSVVFGDAQGATTNLNAHTASAIGRILSLATSGDPR